MTIPYVSLTYLRVAEGALPTAKASIVTVTANCIVAHAYIVVCAILKPIRCETKAILAESLLW